MLWNGIVWKFCLLWKMEDFHSIVCPGSRDITEQRHIEAKSNFYHLGSWVHEKQNMVKLVRVVYASGNNNDNNSYVLP